MSSVYVAKWNPFRFMFIVPKLILCSTTISFSYLVILYSPSCPFRSGQLHIFNGTTRCKTSTFRQNFLRSISNSFRFLVLTMDHVRQRLNSCESSQEILSLMQSSQISNKVNPNEFKQFVMSQLDPIDDPKPRFPVKLFESSSDSDEEINFGAHRANNMNSARIAASNDDHCGTGTKVIDPIGTTAVDESSQSTLGTEYSSPFRKCMVRNNNRMIVPSKSGQRADHSVCSVIDIFCDSL